MVESKHIMAINRELFFSPTDRTESLSRASQIDDLGIYAMTVYTEVDRELKETPIGMYERVFLSPFRNILTRHGYSEEDLQRDKPLEQESRVVASEWRKRHPNSGPAKAIANLGLMAHVGTHVKLLEEMLKEIQDATA